MPEAVALGHAAHNEVEGPGRHFDPGRLAQHGPGIRQRRDHQAVPVGQHLVVEARPHPIAAQHKKLVPQHAKLRFVLRRSRQPVEAIEDIVALEIALLGHVVMLHKKRSIFRAQRLDDLGLRPDVELALLALRIGIQRGRKRPALGGHLAPEPFHRLGGALAEQRLAAPAIGQRQHLQELGVVVEHLLEMRHEPALVDRIAREAAAEVVVDAALADALERVLDQLEEALVAGAQPRPPDQLVERRIGEFRRAAKPAVGRIERAADPLGQPVELGRADHHLALRPGLMRQPLHQGVAVLADFVRLLAKQPRNLAQHVGEGRPAVARGLREISAAPHRLALRRQKHGQRPAALLAQMMQRRHIDLVDVGPLLAVDFDVHEQLVHHVGGRLVLEALVRHDVAPVAGGVADRQQDRLTAAPGLGQRLRPPRPPRHRIVLVLQQIRARFARQPVFRPRWLRGGRTVCGHGGILRQSVVVASGVAEALHLRYVWGA